MLFVQIKTLGWLASQIDIRNWPWLYFLYARTENKF